MLIFFYLQHKYYKEEMDDLSNEKLIRTSSSLIKLSPFIKKRPYACRRAFEAISVFTFSSKTPDHSSSFKSMLLILSLEIFTPS